MHDAFQNSTLEELFVEYYEDYFEKHPSEARKEQAGEDGEFYFTDSGDPLIDKWERELAQGLTPDLTEGMSEQAKQELIKEQEAIARTKGLAARVAQEKQNDPRYEHKFAVPGSDEDAALLGRNPRGANPKDGWEDLLIMGNDK